MTVDEIVEELRGAREENEAGTNDVLAPNWSDKSVRNQRRADCVRHLAKHLPSRCSANTVYVPVVRKRHFLYYTSGRAR